jgi:hypothetical protein
MDLSVYGRPAPRRQATPQAQPATPSSAPESGATASATLSPAAEQLVLNLRGRLGLALLPRYPHVLNRIAELWSDSRRLTSYFEDLLIDSRGSRRGFPLEVISELTRLRDYHQARVNPIKSPTDVWSTVRIR